MGFWPLRGWHADVAIAAGTSVFVIAWTLPSVAGGGELGVLGWTLLVVAPLTLLARRRFPVAVGVATFAACAVYYPFVGAGSPLLLTFVVGLGTVAAEGRVVTAAVIAAVAMAATVFGDLVGPRRHLGDIALFMMLGWLVAAIAVGAVLHGRKAYLREAEQRALAAERSREEEARRRATEERLRIARELHDVLGHNLSLINVQAGAALHRLDRTAAGPVEFRDALDAIKSTSRVALQELRATLGVLRQVDEHAPLTPTPSLAALDDLLDRARAAGLVVRGEVAGDAVPLPSDVDHAAYRIVQEALTNVTRHARAHTAIVRISYGDGEVGVRVDDDGRSAAPGLVGNGIRGMDERARALGGELTASPRPDGGFTVAARLPIGTPS
jgi:signal transduction histidine kinase